METDKKELLELLTAISQSEPVNPQEKSEIEAVIFGSDEIALDTKVTNEVATALPVDSIQKPAISPAVVSQGSGDHEDMRSQISSMLLPEKIKVALYGNAVCRALLIRDSNKMVQQFVLKNPRIQLREVEEFARNPNLSEQVLRTIAGTQAWIKSYAVKLYLVTNPKTPGDVALKWIRFLTISDVRKISKSKNLPQVVVATARKRVAEEQQVRE